MNKLNIMKAPKRGHYRALKENYYEYTTKQEASQLDERISASIALKAPSLFLLKSKIMRG